jgi:chromosome segregation ATPase
LIEQNARRQADCENKIAVNAMEFERELSELDQQSVGLERQIAEVHSNKRKLLDEIQGFENELTAWETKIQVEKETQEELHTSKDVKAVKGMETEIQRMKRRLESLVQTQEQLLRDMELAIHKREDIAVKHKNVKCGSKDSRQNITKGELGKQVKQEKSKLERLDAHVQEAAHAVANVREELSAIQLTLKDTSAKYTITAQLRKSLEKEVAESEFEKNRLLSMCDLHEELLKRYDTLGRGDVPAVNVSARTEFEVEKQMVSGKSRIDKISNIITGLALKFDRYEDIFDRMNLLVATDLVSV